LIWIKGQLIIIEVEDVLVMLWLFQGNNVLLCRFLLLSALHLFLFLLLLFLLILLLLLLDILLLLKGLFDGSVNYLFAAGRQSGG
jgi:hypothetical protein